MSLFLGFDCGGSSTRVFAADATAKRTGWGVAGTGNPHHAAPTEIQAHLHAAAEAACRQAGATLAECEAAFAGVAGVTDEAARRAFGDELASAGLSHARLAVDHDIRIALAGGLAGAPGLALVVGTGSSCYGRSADGHTWQTGGWGALIADEGSGYALGRDAIASAARMADGREPRTALCAAVFSWLGVDDVSALLRRLHASGLDRAGIAALAPRVVALATDGDEAARKILERGAAELASMVAANHRCLPTAPVPTLVITGGLGTADSGYRNLIETSIRAALPSVQIRQPLLLPAQGAFLLALELADLPKPAGLVARLQSLTP